MNPDSQTDCHTSVHLLKNGRWHIASFLDPECSRQLLGDVVQGRVAPEKIFRDNQRTLSARIRFQGKPLLLKVPRARNRRLWERFLTFFRGSDCRRIFHHLSVMASLGLHAPVPVMAGEKRKAGFVTDAFVCYRFVDGRPAAAQDASKVLRALRELHECGYLRTDAQIANFLVDREKVIFIDFRLKKPLLCRRLQIARELDRFLRSCPEARAHLPSEETSSFWAKAAHSLENLKFAKMRLKRHLRKYR